MVTMKFIQEEWSGCKDVILTDKTGVWDVDSNRTGWDDGSFTSDNYCVADISAIKLLMIYPDGRTNTIAIDPATSKFPGISQNPFIRITSAMMGYGAGKKPDGIVSITLEVTFNKFQGNPISPAVIISEEYQFMWLCQSWCCLSNLSTKIKKNKIKKAGCVPCQNADPAIEVWSLLTASAQAALCTDGMDAAETKRLEAQKICTSNGCNC